MRMWHLHGMFPPCRLSVPLLSLMFCNRGGEVIGLSPNIRIYRYSKGQYFDCHCRASPLSSFFLFHSGAFADYTFSDDESNNLTIIDEDTKQVSVKTTWTLLLYLTSTADGCQGGETVFYPHDRRSAKEEIAIPPETGMLLLHKHGDDCMLVGLCVLSYQFPVCCNTNSEGGHR